MRRTLRLLWTLGGNADSLNSLAMEYKLRLIYKKPFNDVLQEEQSSRDFGPLLGRMGVVDEQGQSAMNADQWEAASESNHS